MPGDTDLSNITQQQLVELAHHLNSQPGNASATKPQPKSSSPNAALKQEWAEF
jgi:hypothetical protein